jgi:hypothetical protein
MAWRCVDANVEKLYTIEARAAAKRLDYYREEQRFGQVIAGAILNGLHHKTVGHKCPRRRAVSSQRGCVVRENMPLPAPSGQLSQFDEDGP